LQFATNETYGEAFARALPNSSPQFLSALSGMSAGMTEAFIVVSFELVKIRLQDKNSVGKYNNATDVVKSVMKTEGRGFFFCNSH
jgi:solute carrier family 25 2-oxodicarboxylate transporter 21